MKDEDLDRMLNDLPKPPPEGDHVDDAVLLAHRRGELSEAEARAVERHLATCQDCRDLFAELAAPVADDARARARDAITSPPPRRRWARVAAAVAAAAAALLAIGLGRSASELPGYVMQGPFGGRQALRGDRAPTRTFDQDSRLELTFRPERPVKGARPHLRLYVGAPGGALERVRVSAQRSEDGAFRVVAPARDVLGLIPGPYDLHAILRRAEAAPARFASAADIEAFAGDLPHFTARVELLASEDNEP